MQQLLQTTQQLLQTTQAAQPTFVTARHLADLYKVTPAAVRHWAATGKIPFTKFERTLRFDLAAVRGVIEGGGAK